MLTTRKVDKARLIRVWREDEMNWVWLPESAKIGQVFHVKTDHRDFYVRVVGFKNEVTAGIRYKELRKRPGRGDISKI